MTTWAIKDWETTFETADLRRRVNTLSWVSLPVKLTGRNYRRLIRKPGGIEAYAVFLALVQVAARCDVRGVLASKGEEISPEDLSIMTDMPQDVIERAIQVLSDKAIAWIVPSNSQRVPAAPSESQPTRQNKTEKNKTEQQQQQQNNARGAEPEIAAAAAEIPDLDLRRSLLRREEWVPEGKPWLTPRAAEIIARSSATTPEIRQVLKAARDGRKTLANPAGYIIAQLSRRHPDAKDRREAG